MQRQRTSSQVVVGIPREGGNGGDKATERLNLVWKKIADASEKELGRVPKELQNIWELQNRQKPKVLSSANETDPDEGDGDESLASDSEEDSYDEDKKPKTVTELKLKAYNLADKKTIKKEIETQRASEQREDTAPSVLNKVDVRDSDWFTSTQNTRKRLLNSSLWRIQAEFGSTVVSFFEFLRWTIFLNIFNALFVLMLVFVPQIVENNNVPNKVYTFCSQLNGHCSFSSSNKTTMFDITCFPIENVSNCCSEKYGKTLEEQAFHFNQSTFFPSLGDLLANLLQGTGWMESTPMFYGYYDGTYRFEFNDITFDFPLAFFLVILVIMMVNLIIIVISSAKSFYNSIEEQSEQRAPFSNIIFSRWDFGITKEEGVKILKADIKTNLKLALATGSKTPTTHKTWAIRFFVNLFVFGALGGFLYLIFWVTTDKTITDKNRECKASGDDRTFGCFMYEYLPSFTVTGGNLLLPFLFTILIGMEKYTNKNMELFFNLSRCIALRLASLLVALLSMKTTVSCDYYRDGKGNQVCSNAGIDGVDCQKPICWETYVGQQFYMLTTVDFLAQVGLVFFLDFPRSFLFGKLLEGTKTFESLHQMAGRIEFNVSKHVLDIVYTQAICWLAIFYAPLISIVTVIKCTFIYALRIFFVVYVCVPSQVAFSASRSSAFFKGFLLLSFGLTIICVSLFIGVVPPSSACGPFRDVTSEQGNRLVYDYVINIIETSDLHFLQDLLFFLGQTSVLYSIAGVLLLVTYFIWAKSSADGALLQQMRKQLKMVKADSKEKHRMLRADLRAFFK